MDDLAGLLLEFAGSDDIGGVCEGLARAVARCTDARFAAVVTADADGGSFDAFGDARAPWRFLARLQGTFNRARVDGDPLRRAFLASDEVSVADVRAHAAAAAGFAATAQAFGIRSLIALPIVADGMCAGVAGAYFGDAAVLDAAKIAVLRVVVEHGGAALARARRFERLEGDAEQHAALVAETAEGFCTLNDRLAVVLWNSAAEQITGVSAAEIVTKSLTDTFANVEVPSRPGAFASFEALAEAFASARSHTIEVGFRRGGGDTVWLSIVGATVGGRIHRRHLVCCFRDITEQKRLEGLRSEFVSLVTHQLRTPLTSIRGYAELLGAVEMPPDQVMEFGTIIANASTRLASSITDVMDFEQLAASRDGMHIVRLRLSDVIDAALSSLVPPPRHAVHVHADAKDIYLDADLDRLTRAFAHLIGNADRYWPGDGEIIVDAARSNGEVSVAISDRGPGIDTNVAGDLFSPYHHAARRRSNAGQGLGLGLSLSKRIVESHAGRMAVEQPPGGGTTVRVWLPST